LSRDFLSFANANRSFGGIAADAAVERAARNAIEIGKGARVAEEFSRMNGRACHHEHRIADVLLDGVHCRRPVRVERLCVARERRKRAAA
jgi:hypothetical protein